MTLMAGARLEGRVALDELLNRFPNWSVDYENAQLAPTSTVKVGSEAEFVQTSRQLKEPRPR